MGKNWEKIAFMEGMTFDINDENIGSIECTCMLKKTDVLTPEEGFLLESML